SVLPTGIEGFAGVTAIDTSVTVPTPERLTVCVLPATPWLLSVMVRVPESKPVVVGEKLMLMVQVPPAGTAPPLLTPQESLSRKLVLAAMLVMVSVLLPVLVRVMGCDPLVVPSICSVNARVDGESVTPGATPVYLAIKASA